MTERTFGSGININGPIKIAGAEGTDTTVVTSNGHVEFDQLQAEAWPQIPALAPRQQSDPYQLIITFGDSNMVGTEMTENGTGNGATHDLPNASAYTQEPDGKDAPHPKVFEVSRGLRGGSRNPAPVGELMQLKEPCQDDLPLSVADGIDPGGNGGMSAKLTMGRRMVELNPNIKQVAFLNCAVGGSGINPVVSPPAASADNERPGWGASLTGLDSLLEGLIADATTFMEAHPHFVCTIIASSIGAVDGFYEMDETTHRTELKAIIDKIRAEVPRADGAFYIAQTIAPKLVEYNLKIDGVTTFYEGTAPAIEASLRSLGTDPAAADNATFLDLLDNENITTTEQDALHLSEQSLRYVGNRLGELAVQEVGDSVSAAAVRPTYRMLWDEQEGRFTDVNGSGALIHAERIEYDDTYGNVLYTEAGNTDGFQTDIQLNLPAHTLFMRIKLDQTVTTTAPLFCGRRRNETFQLSNDFDAGRIITPALAYYQNALGYAAGLNIINLHTGGTALQQGVWASIAISYDGTTVSSYKDGTVVVSAAVPSPTTLDDPQFLELLTYNAGQPVGTGNSAVATVLAAITDIRVLPYAADATEINEMHLDTRAEAPAAGSALALKADQTTVDAALLLKADQTAVDASLLLKADITNLLTEGNAGRTATYLGTNPLAGSDWSNQLASGLYTARYQYADNAGLPANTGNPGALPTTRGLPWNPHVYANDGDASLSPATYLIDISAVSLTAPGGTPVAGFARAYTFGEVRAADSTPEFPTGTLILRAWTAFLSVSGGAWVAASGWEDMSSTWVLDAGGNIRGRALDAFGAVTYPIAATFFADPPAVP